MIPILGVLGHVKCLLSLLLLVIGTKTYLWFFSPAHVWGINLAKDILCPKESMLNVNRRACCAAWCLPAKVSVWAEPACPMVGARSTDSQCCDHTFLWNSCKYLQDYWNTETISGKDLWSSNPLMAEQGRSHPCIALFRLIWCDSGDQIFRHFLWAKRATSMAEETSM